MRAPTTLLLILLSAALHAMAFPPWNAPAVAFVALVPLFITLSRCTPWRGFAVGLLWGTTAIWGVGYWVPAALAHYWDQPGWFGVLFALGASIVFAGSYYGGFGATAAWLQRRTSGPLRVMLLAAAWVAWELARARLLTGDPWLLFGYSLMPWPVCVQVADFGGVYAVSFVLVGVNAAIAELLQADPSAARRVGGKLRRGIKAALTAAVLVGAAYAYGLYRLGEKAPEGRLVRVSVVQGNLDAGSSWRIGQEGLELERYLELSRRAVNEQRPDLLVWPESAVTSFLAHEPVLQASLASFLDGGDAELLIGAPHYELGDPAQPDYFNSAFHFTSSGHADGRYDKQHLLPFAEYFPLRTIEFLRRRFERVRAFTPGAARPLLQTRFGPVATAICFEGIFPELVRQQMAGGALVLVNLSNDAWLGAGAGPAQHLSMVALRAVEHRTWVVRATTTGISVLIDPYGRIQSSAPMSQPALLHGIIPFAVRDTPYQRWGDAFAYACLAATAVGCVLPRRRRSGIPLSPGDPR